MKLIGLMLARNESWVLPCTLTAALRWCDEIVFINHASTDRTSDLILDMKEKRIHYVYRKPEEYWAEMDARQESLELGRGLGGTHFAICDADEMLTANHLEGVRMWFELLAPGQCVDVPMIAPWKGLTHYSPHTRGVITLGFADTPKLCWKPRGDEKYHHHARPPHGSLTTRLNPAGIEGGCFHLQWAAWDRMLWKHRHYMMTERLRWKYPVAEINDRYHWAMKPPHGRDLKPIPSAWYGDYPISKIELDHVPWYKSECEKLWEKHGKETFAGLDLWGFSGGQRA